MFSLEGKTALITGAKRGIGKAIALTFAEAGADVALATRVLKDARDDLEDVADSIRKMGRRALAVEADVSQKADVDEMVRKTMDGFGGIDILVNNVGGHRGTVGKPSALQVAEEDWRYTIDLTLNSCYLCCRSVGNIMVEKEQGCIINIASGAAFQGNSSPYGVAKAGMVRLTKGLALELAAFNIRVNALAPTWIKTEMTRRLWDNADVLKRLESRLQLGHRIGEVSDMTGPALFLASDAAKFVTGLTIPVDGGRSAFGDYYLNPDLFRKK
jgi:NAD(P)-dependent dehydrogenase (short-subunit alcohol dehydrogenase family)